MTNMAEFEIFTLQETRTGEGSKNIKRETLTLKRPIIGKVGSQLT